MSLTARLCIALATLLGCNDVPEGDIGEDWDGPKGKWVEVWRDDFNAPVGTPPDPAKWNIEVRAKSANEELQYYTDRPQNVQHDGEGHLVIQALSEKFESALYTSARLNTRTRFEPQYGRIEARIQVPGGKGMWPAFWMLGSNFSKVGWPKCGEIDIMEFGGSRPDTIYGSVHGPEYYGNEALKRLFQLDSGGFPDNFHEFAFEWTQEGMRWLIDGSVYHARTRKGFEELEKKWVFDQPFYIILNLAVGGMFDGNPDATTPFPGRMLVDYVKVSRLE